MSDSISLLKHELHMLREENDTLREHIRQLKELLVPEQLSFSTVLKVTKTEDIILVTLISAESRVVSRSVLMNILYCMRITDREVPQEKIIDVYICTLRTKLKPWNIEIHNSFGRGYFIPTKSRDNALMLLGIVPEVSNKINVQEEN